MPSDADIAPRTLVLSRVFDAPRAVLFQAWTTPAQVAAWWGPLGYVTTHCDMDIRPGGSFRVCMRSPEGVDHWKLGVYREIVAPERLVFVNSFSDASGGTTRAPFPQLKDKWPLEVLNVMTLAEEGGKTTLTLRGGPINATEEERALFASQTNSMQQGFGGTFDKLAEYLAG